jgi:hypothetical protein
MGLVGHDPDHGDLVDGTVRGCPGIRLGRFSLGHPLLRPVISQELGVGRLGPRHT